MDCGLLCVSAVARLVHPVDLVVPSTPTPPRWHLFRERRGKVLKCKKKQKPNNKAAYVSSAPFSLSPLDQEQPGFFFLSSVIKDK